MFGAEFGHSLRATVKSAETTRIHRFRGLRVVVD